jgi:hypothetical protein
MNDDSAELTVRWFQEIENRLSDLLRIVSLDAHNSAAIFPQLTSVIIDSGSLVDTIFREEFASTHKKRRDLTIKDFAPFFQTKLNLAELKAVLYQYPLSYVTPFAEWVDPATREYKSISWC